MIVDRIILKNFRSYDYVDAKLDKGLNIIVGENGSGKSNLAEAIHYLSLGKSFRTINDKELVKIGKDIASIDTFTHRGETKNQIKIVLSKENKTILINSKKVKKLSSLSGVMNVIIFKPSDVNIYKGSPSNRRKLIDIAISKQDDIYLDNLTNYNKILKERNELLKSDVVDKIYLDVLDTQISELALSISRCRDRYIKSINEILNKVLSKLTDEKEQLTLVYHPFVDLKDTNKKEVKNLYNSYLDSDIKNKSTTIGPHREDITMYLGDKDISKYGSQGQNRIAAIALILTPYFLIQDVDKKPVVILDDVLSELDAIHQKKLLTLASKLQQCIITATNISKYGDAIIYEIKNNKITRREP